jgi:hypothetical protein
MWNELPPWNYTLLYIINLKFCVRCCIFSYYISIVILLLTANWFIHGGSVLQCKIGQYNTITSHIITYNTQGNSLYAKLKKIKNTQTHTRARALVLYHIKTQKRVEPKVGESVLKPLGILNNE